MAATCPERALREALALERWRLLARSCNPGSALVAGLTGLREAVEAADAVITGEGSLDQQTLNGKGPHGVAVLARSLGKPVVALAGRVQEGCGLEQEFDLARAIAPPGTSGSGIDASGRTMAGVGGSRDR